MAGLSDGGVDWGFLAPLVYTTAMSHGAVFCISKMVQASRFERVARWGKRLEIVTYLTTAVMSFMLLKIWPDVAGAVQIVGSQARSAGLSAENIEHVLPMAMVGSAINWALTYLVVVGVISFCYAVVVVGRRRAYVAASARLEQTTRRCKQKIRNAEQNGCLRYRRLAVSAPSCTARLGHWLHDNPPKPLTPAHPRWEVKWCYQHRAPTYIDRQLQDRYRITNRTGSTAFSVTVEPENIEVNHTRSAALVAARLGPDDALFVQLDTIIGLAGRMRIRWHGTDQHEHSDVIHLQYTPVSQHNRYHWLRKWRRRKNRMRAGEPQPESLVGAGVHDG
ncbi:hypothetical protein AFM11_02320 [Mycolicibacterium wolinskyi]|uniref:Uncharacterized protein n=1 Tax=Mycolicibacterium wolinskyi TaxID=59750 RepID=A0A132PVA7_9MYCO|nr:hypothetical protein [Mycolicibacterium wolinskyi]KWX26097.1 hypothetical protein AFM11_02320 [Mycolicibacterium wolinskyi]